MKYLIFVFCLLAPPAFAQCPDPTMTAPRYAASGPELIVPQSWEVRAEGAFVAPCTDWADNGFATNGLDGFLPAAPTAVFELDGLGPHILMVVAQAACQPVLAVRTGDGFWFFGDATDDRQGVTLWGAPDGEVHVWVGTDGSQGCPATLTLETFDK